MNLALFSAFEACRSRAFLLAQQPPNPRVISFLHGGEHKKVNVYIWTISHGGGAARPEDEYRIQMTSVTPPLSTDGDFTVLMGYYPDLQVFVGWDVRRHQTWTGRSPSLQIKLPVLQSAVQNGLAFHLNKHGELAVAMRPELLTAYITLADLLHTYGDAAMGDALVAAAADPYQEPEAELPLEDEPQKRQTIVSVIQRLCRDSRFQQTILGAYGFRCACTRAQLGLVQAAHILPVANPESMDNVQNGIALSPTYHIAYDAGLIYLDEDYHMKLNPRHVTALEERGWMAGMEGFSAALGPIHLPPQPDWYPSLENIRKANEQRDI